MSALRLIRDDRDRFDDERPAVDLLDAWGAYQMAAGLVPATVGIRRRSLEAAMSYCRVRDPRYQVGDLVAGLKRPKRPQPVARPIDDRTIERLLALELGGRAHLYVRLALYQALRVHEIAKIRGEDFDHASGWLMVTGKGGVTAPIPIHPEISRLAERMPEVGFWFPVGGDPGAVGASGRGVADDQVRATDGRFHRHRAPAARHRGHPDAAAGQGHPRDAGDAAA